MKHLFKIVVLLFIYSNNFFAQNPIYYTIGENELNDVNIYSILEANNGDIYISSDNGIYRYNNGIFFNIPKPKIQKGNSLFSLVKTTSGTIFCSNLKGQIFKVHNNTLELFYTIPNEFLTYFPYLLTDTKDNLLVISKQIDVLTSKGKLIDTIRGFKHVEKNINKQIVIKNTNTSYYFLSEKENRYPLPFNLRREKQYYKKLILSRNLVGAKTKAYYFDMNDKLPIDVTNNSVLTYNSSIYLNKLRTYGVQEIILENNTFKKGKLFFKNTFISSLAKGENGTLYLGTFKQGLRIVPNYNFKSVKTAEQPRSIVNFDVKNDNEIYLNVRGKGLKYFNSRTQKTVLIESKYTNQDVFCSSDIKFQHSIDFPDVFIQSSEKNIGFGGVKDITQVTNIGYLVATSEGLLFEGDVNAFKNIYSSENIRNRKEFNKNVVFLAQVDERCTAVKYEPKTKTIYVATQNKLLAITKGVISEIKYQNQSIIANSLVLVNDELFIGSEQQGVLKYQHNAIQLLYDKSNGLADNSVKKIAIQNNYLFVLNTDFLQYINLETNKIKPLNKGEGIIGYINEFHLSKNKLWVLTDNTTIMSMSLPQLKKIETKLRFKVDSLQINNNKINTDIKSRFSYSQNNFNAFFHLKSDSYRNQTQIKYKLKGFDDAYRKISANTKSATYKKLPSGQYTFSVYAQYGTVKSNEFVYNFTITPPFWETWWFRLFCVLAILLVAISYYKYKMTQQKKKTKEKLKQQQIQTDLVEAKLTALRSQMNPHFIFNALNSIQNLILKQDSEASYDYVVLFSKLVRNTLNYSEEEFIALEEEVEFLDIYLQLEKLRFGDDFSYKIINECSEHIEVPSLLVQPFVENALLHGLLSKVGEKKVTIRFSMDDKKLTCTVSDNGIGREKSAEIQQRQGKSNKSFALTAIQKRLDILKKQYGETIGYTFTDLYKNKIDSGTKVIIILPYRQ